MRNISLKLPAVILLSIGAFLRLYKLGYSNLQGDEVKAMGFLTGEKDFYTFLLNNSKGPGQYIITRFTYLFAQNLERQEFLFRLPFALAGIGVLLVIYLTVRKYFSNGAAIISLLLLSNTGLLIAFSRLTQYQSFVMLASAISYLFINHYLKNNAPKVLFLAGIAGSIGLLFHFDALSFIIPIGIFLIIKKNLSGLKYYLLGLVPSFLFYIPYVLTETFRSTLKYIIFDRSISYFHFDPVYYSLKLLSLYNSREYIIVLIFGFIVIMYQILKSSKIPGKLLGLFFAAILVSRFLIQTQRRELALLSLCIGVIMLIITVVSQTQKSRHSNLKLYNTFWFLISFSVYFLFLSKPLTHIYNFVIPMSILISIELYEIYSKNKILIILFLAVSFISSSSFNFQAFIDTSKEYPWESKNYIFGSMYQGITEGEVVRGIFGFSYYRSLEQIPVEIEKINNKGLEIKNYYSNEELAELGFYLQGYNWTTQTPYFYINVHNTNDKNIPEKFNFEPVSRTKNFEIYLVN